MQSADEWGISFALGQSKDNNTFKETRHILPLSLHFSTHLRAE
jgi:hypothetical protein